MASKDYYDVWLKVKAQIESVLSADQRLQDLAIKEIGIKPQGVAVDVVGRVYVQYCKLYNILCECYDQMCQVQRRPYIKGIIDTITCRILELKSTLETVENFEFTYPENSLQQLLMIPQEVEILCPFFYSFEIRQQEMQLIIDKVFTGNYIPSAIKLQEEQPLEETVDDSGAKKEDEKSKISLEEETESTISEKLSPEEIEALKLQEEYNRCINDIQRMERSRKIIREKTRKFNKDAALYLELAGTKKPEARAEIKEKAAMMIQSIYRRFMKIKREDVKNNKLKEKLGMIITSSAVQSAKIELEKVKEIRRNFRRKYYDEWLKQNIVEKNRVLKLREGDIMEDISAEIRQWLQEWYDKVRTFDEFPWPGEGGSILIVKGETFTTDEYAEWRQAEDKRLKEAAGSPKSKEQIKAEKLAAKLEKKRLEIERIEKEKKRILDYKKMRLNPANDPGVYITLGQQFESLKQAWEDYQNQWRSIDEINPPIDVMKGFINQLLIEDIYQNVHLELRPIVDEMMKIEIDLLRKALKNDYLMAGIARPPQSQKRKKPKKPPRQKPEKVSPATMFYELFKEGIIKKCPKFSIDDFWGDKNYAAADMRAVPWTPSFPPPCIGDVREQVRLRCLLTLGSNCNNATRCQLLVGPTGSGKKSLIYAIASETNALLIDLSPLNIYNKFPGPKLLKTMLTYVNKISRLMQPTIILVDEVDKLFYKKVPPEEKMYDPTRLQKDFVKEIVKPITENDKILIIGTAAQPWLARAGPMSKAFQSVILFPRTDYGSISFILKQTLMKYHGVDREFNVHSVAQVLRGYDISTIRRAVENLLKGKRTPELYYKPLEPVEVLEAVMSDEKANYVDPTDYEMYTEWYNSYSPWGQEYLYYMSMLESQLVYKLKAEKKKK